MFAETAGCQCASNALFLICWPLDKLSFLSVDDLPREIQIFQYIVRVEMKVENLHDGLAFLGKPFLKNILAISGYTTG